MDLNLSHPATPEHAPAHAQDIVRLAKIIHQLELDYSVGSLEGIDAIIEDFRAGGASPDDLGETLFAMGCYVGEVLVRHALGVWKNASDTALASVAGFPIVIQLPGGQIANPIHRAFKRLINGPRDSVADYYRAIVAGA